MIVSAQRAFGVELHDTSTRQQGHDAGHSELHRLLNSVIGSLAAADSLGKAHGQRGLFLDIMMLTGSNNRHLTLDPFDCRVVFAAAAVEEPEPRADLEPQHA